LSTGGAWQFYGRAVKKTASGLPIRDTANCQSAARFGCPEI